MMRNGIRAMFAVLLLGGCSPETVDQPTPPAGDSHAYVWSMSMDSTGRDGLLVLDMDTTSAKYGTVIGEVMLDSGGMMPHHIERRVHSDGRLIGNTWVGNKNWVFDVSTPAQPRIVSTFQTAGNVMGWAHDYSRLPNGNTLVAFNGGPADYVGAGGLAEVDAGGAVVQSAMATMAGLGDTAATPYVVTALPGRDRALVGLGEMGMGPDYKYHEVNMLQLWSTKPLAPLALIPLAPSGTDRGHLAPSSIGATANGELFTNTFYCGLYHVTELKGDTPSASRVFTFPGGTDETLCGVATTIGNYWIQAVAALPGLMVVDLSTPSAPRVASQLVLDSTAFKGVHWVSSNKEGTRLAITGEGGWLVMARFDPATGVIALDDKFTTQGSATPGIMIHNRAGQMLHPHGVAWGP